MNRLTARASGPLKGVLMTSGKQALEAQMEPLAADFRRLKAEGLASQIAAADRSAAAMFRRLEVGRAPR